MTLVATERRTWPLRGTFSGSLSRISGTVWGRNGSGGLHALTVTSPESRFLSDLILRSLMLEERMSAVRCKSSRVRPAPKMKGGVKHNSRNATTRRINQRANKQKPPQQIMKSQSNILQSR